MKKTVLAVLRVALYIRVSSQEQAIKGLSLEAQQEDLEEYARERGWVIQGIYIDAAKTARKRLGKRDNFLRMLEAVKRGEVDLILFTRLDRWFRSVADYYKVKEVLESHNCGWLTTQEQYDTTTAGGRLYINLRLSIAQNEADLCGERISVVFDSKIKHGTAVSGSCPFGYRVNDEKRLEVVPEEAAIVLDAFQYYKSTVSQRGTITHIREVYGVNWCSMTFHRMLREKLYIGYYERNGRVNAEFCPPIVPVDLFNDVQKMLPLNSKAAPSGRVYLFSSLLVCAECGHKLVVNGGCTGRVYYRCDHYTSRRLCNHDRGYLESRMEEWLFSHLGDELEKCRLEWDIKEAERRKSAASIDRAAVKRKLSRLKELYVNEVIDLEEYRRDYDLYMAQLADRPTVEQEQRPNFEAVASILTKDYRTIYDTLDRAEKRTLWRSIIKEIHINRELEITRVVFL